MTASHQNRSLIDQRLSRRQALVGGAAGLAVVSGVIPSFGSVAAQEATPVADAAATWEEIDEQLAAVAPQTALLAAEIVDGAPELIHGANADVEMPVGSSFKFYVLGAIAQQIEAGELDWEQIITIEDEHKSVPSGDLRYAPAGAEYTLRYVAERMMQKSDNTATDVLIYLAGRERVEAMFETMGHQDASLNIPLMTTREFAFMKLVLSTEDLDTYYAADVEERRRILAEEIDPMPYEALAVADNQTVPIELNRVEWFASRNDLANAVTWLWEASQREGLRPITEVMALETQLVFNGEIWPYVGFKGGSELGLVNGTWLLQRNDGRMFIYSIIFADPEAPLDMTAVVPVMEQGRDRLALTP